jgi:two-component system nitrate/nitrite response regulator NarL
MLAAKVALTTQPEKCRPEVFEGLLASSLVTYGLSVDAFMQSLRLMLSGEWGLPHDLTASQNHPAQASDSKPQGGGDRLSPRERDVLLQVVEGHVNKAIALHLGITEARVKAHLKNLLRKIKVENRTQATIWALANLPELALRAA